jgi:hypothetical protein
MLLQTLPPGWRYNEYVKSNETDDEARDAERDRAEWDRIGKNMIAQAI